jgi:hypothetical protein
LFAVSSLLVIPQQAKAISLPNPTPVFRFYKLADGSHFFTNNESEKNVVSQRPDIYRYEGVAFYEYTSQVANSVPVYRFYNFKQGVHFYTASQSEYQNVLTTGSWTYRYEGVAYYTLTAVSNGLAPVHRFYKFRQGVHFYTNNQAEATYLNNTAYSTYRYEGVAYYSPDHLSFSGSGTQTTESFVLPTALTKFTMDYSGTSNFIVWLKEANTGDDYSLVANEIGATSFSAPVGVDENRYILEVQSSGPWTINLEFPKASSGIVTSFSGTGSSASPLFTIPSGAHTLSYSHNDSSAFIVYLWDGAGNLVDVPVIESGVTSGSVLISSDGGDYMMGIETYGNWAISIL